jgi:TetR/AcrR family transcriptional repressor of nem operon
VRASEASRQGAPVQKAITESLRSTFKFLKTHSWPREADEAKTAIATYASLVGGMILARAVEDRALSNEILDAVRTSITRRASRRYAR